MAKFERSSDIAAARETLSIALFQLQMRGCW
jgi:hypothetical protein